MSSVQPQPNDVLECPDGHTYEAWRSPGEDGPCPVKIGTDRRGRDIACGK